MLFNKDISPHLNHSSELFHNAFQHSTDAILITDLQGNIVETNRAFSHLFGWTRQEAIGQNVRILRSSKSTDEFYKQMWKSIESKGAWKGEVVNKRKDGSEIPVLLSISPIYHEGKKVGYMGFEIDFTEKKKIENQLLQAKEDALKRSEANFKKAQELAHLGSYELHVPLASSKDVHWSDETFHIVGLDPANGEPSLEEYLPNVVFEDRPRLLEALNNAMNDAIPFEIEYSLVRPDGALRHVQSIGEPIRDQNGKIVKLVGTLLDITERKKAREALKESEARIRAIVETAVDGIITIDEKGIVQSFNSAAERLFGYTLDEAIGQDISILIPPPHRSEHHEYMMNYLKSGQKKIIGIGREVIGQRKDGSTFPLYLAVSEFFLGDRRMFNGIVHDMTKQSQLQKKILQSERLATIGQMAAKVAHEIRNPLSSISLNAELLEDELRNYKSANTNEANALLESIISEVERVTALTEEYLQFSRLPESRPIKGNIEDAINDMIEIVQHELSQNNIEFEFEVKNGKMELNFDRLQVRRVLLNIIRNAIEAMPQGGKLKIWTDRNDHKAIINIQDTGMGISEDMIDKIYNPFFTTKDFGTGLGLAITQQIINEHGGQIYCDSHVGEGTIFTIELPLNQLN